jgi:hypothetical protein
MSELIIREVDELGNSTDRPMTTEEIKAWEYANKIAIEEKNEAIKKAQNRASALAKLTALGLTEEEIAAL